MKKQLALALFLLFFGKTIAQTLIATNSEGQLLRFNADSTGHQVLHQFGGSSGAAGVTQNCGLTLHGAELFGFTRGNFASGNGASIFKIPTVNGAAQLFQGPPTELLNFDNFAVQGKLPQGRPLVVGSRLFGVAQFGGSQNRGTLFSINLDGSDFKVLRHFKGGANDGREPVASLMQASDGRIYGSTTRGGPDNKGILFSILPDGADFFILKNFTGGTDDAQAPEHMLFESTLDNRMYGVTTTGGQFGFGTLFKIAKTGDLFEVAHHFQGPEGIHPTGELVADGFSIFGTMPQTFTAASFGAGGIFELNLGNGSFQKAFQLPFNPGQNFYAQKAYSLHFDVNSSTLKTAVLNTDAGLLLIEKGSVSGLFGPDGLPFGNLDAPSGIPHGLVGQRPVFANGRFYALGEQGGFSQFGADGSIFSVKVSEEFFQFMHRFDTTLLQNGGLQLGRPMQAGNGKIYVGSVAAGSQTDPYSNTILGSVNPDGTGFKLRVRGFKAALGHLAELKNKQIAGSLNSNKLIWTTCDNQGAGLENVDVIAVPNTPAEHPFFQGPTNQKIYLKSPFGYSITSFSATGSLPAMSDFSPYPSGSFWKICSDFDPIEQNFIGFRSQDNLVAVWKSFKDGSDYTEFYLPGSEVFEPRACVFSPDGFVYGISRGNGSLTGFDPFGKFFRAKTDGTGFEILFDMTNFPGYGPSPAMQMAMANGRVFFNFNRQKNGVSLMGVASFKTDGSDLKIGYEKGDLVNSQTPVLFNFMDPTMPVIGDPVAVDAPFFEKTDLRVFPNPTADGRVSLFIKSEKGLGEARFSVIDAMGRSLLFLKKTDIAAGENLVELDLTGLPTGLYFLKMEAQKGAATTKIIVQD